MIPISIDPNLGPDDWTIRDASADATLALQIVERIKPILAGQPPTVQGAVLADLLSLWLAGHFLMGNAVIESVLETHIQAVRQLLPVSIVELQQR
jgi:hypothetical protein